MQTLMKDWAVMTSQSPGGAPGSWAAWLFADAASKEHSHHTVLKRVSLSSLIPWGVPTMSLCRVPAWHSVHLASPPQRVCSPATGPVKQWEEGVLALVSELTGQSLSLCHLGMCSAQGRACKQQLTHHLDLSQGGGVSAASAPLLPPLPL